MRNDKKILKLSLSKNILSDLNFMIIISLSVYNDRFLEINIPIKEIEDFHTITNKIFIDYILLHLIQDKYSGEEQIDIKCSWVDISDYDLFCRFYRFYTILNNALADNTK